VTYHIPGSDDRLDQADIVSNCLIPLLTELDVEGVKPPQIQVSPCRILVLTQACDLTSRKASNATVAVVLDAHTLVEQNLIKPADVRGPICAGRVFGWYFLLGTGQRAIVTPKLSGGAQRGPLHAVVRWRSVTRGDVLAPRNEAPPCRSCRL
jgi:hypothetical protein